MLIYAHLFNSSSKVDLPASAHSTVDKFKRNIVSLGAPYQVSHLMSYTQEVLIRYLSS